MYLYSIRVGRTDCTPRNIILKNKKIKHSIIFKIYDDVFKNYFIRNVCSGCGVLYTARTQRAVERV